MRPIESYVVAVLLGRHVVDWINASALTLDPDDLNRMLAKRGAFHAACIAANLWNGHGRGTIFRRCAPRVLASY
jgi:cytosine/adenosine deaminase-related metal-dependent hydrolase